MPGDSLNVNNKAVSQNTYDAIVVGSGISGGWAAKELCEKGLKVLMLERGHTVQHPNYPTATLSPWDFPHRNTLSNEDKKDHAIQSRHFSYREDTKHFYINDRENPYDEINRFDWVRGNIVGGRSLLWGRACYRWSDWEFGSNLKDGHGVDWPIRYKDIAPWYDYVETFVGVSGNKDGIPSLPDGQFQPPFQMNCVEADFKTRLEGKYKDRKVIIGRTANLTQPVKGRGQCQARDLCHRGCPFGAYFSTNASTLPAAFATGNLTLKPNSLVNRVIYDEQKKRATGVEIIDTETKQTSIYYAKIIFLNASTVATTGILLNSISSRFPNGLGNGSDQIGRNLMDHHKGVSVTAMADGFEDKYYYGRRPNPSYIPRFINLDKQDTKDFLRGYHYGVTAGRTRPEPDAQIGGAFKDAITEPGPWRITLYAYGECLPYADNRITLNTNKKNPWGRPMLTVDCTFRENEQNMHKHMIATAQEMLEATGYKNPKSNSAISAPGNANHEMGTARMGRDPKTSVLNAFNQMHEVPNVFITDGSCMPSSSCLNPSITYMALTARACDYAVKELKKMNI
ncbi:MAG: GMC family oxidoreductase [Chitinophagaceae bacterium]